MSSSYISELLKIIGQVPARFTKDFLDHLVSMAQAITRAIHEKSNLQSNLDGSQKYRAPHKVPAFLLPSRDEKIIKDEDNWPHPSAHKFTKN